MAFFEKPGALVAWGLNGGDWTPEQLAQDVAGCGFEWIAVQFGDADNEPKPELLSRLRTACREAKLLFGIWEQDPRTLDNVLNVRPNLWLPAVERPWDGYEQMLAEFRTQRPRLPAGVITNFNHDSKPFIDNGFRCLPEAYLSDDPNVPAETASPVDMMNRAREEGWPRAFPCLGVHRYKLADYGAFPWDSRRGFSVYLWEYMVPEYRETARVWTGHA